MKKEALKKVYHFMMDFKTDMNRKNVSSFAASAAFFIFVSMIPVLYILCSIISVIDITEMDLVEAVEVVAPNIVGDFFAGIISDIYETSVGVVSIAIFITIWSAGKGMLALMRGLNEMNEVEEKRNYFVIRGIAGFYTIIMIFLVIAALIFFGFGKVLISHVLEFIPGIETILEWIMQARFLYVWLIFTFLFALIYAYMPNKKSKMKLQLPGAVLSAVLWSVFSWGFSLYINYFGGYGEYGSLTTIVIVLMWLYFMMYIFFIGAKINIIINTYKNCQKNVNYLS